KIDSGWMIVSSGTTGAPVDFSITRFEMKYSNDWQPLEMKLDARAGTKPVGVLTSFALTSAINEISQEGRTLAKNDQISARTIVIPNNVFGSYEALAVRLWDSKVDDELPVYVAPQAEVKAKIKSIANQTMSGPGASLTTRRYEVTFQNPGHVANAVVVVD